MVTHCQTAALSRSSERTNLGAVNSFEGKKQRRGGGGGQLETNLIRIITCKMCLFSLYKKCNMEELKSLLYIIFH